MKKRYAVLVGAIVLGMMAFGACSALAVTVSPAGVLTAKQGTITYSTKSKLTCAEAAYKGTMSSTGVGTFEKEGISMSGCHIILGAPFFQTPHEEPVSMQPLSTWNLQITTPNATGDTFSVNNVLLRFALTGAPSCAFYIGGSWNDPNGYTTIRSIPYGPSYSSTLKVTQVSECAKALNMASLGESVAVSSPSGIVFGTPLTYTR